MEARQIVINNLLLNYYVAGSKQAAPAVVFLHGWRSEGRVWGQVIERFFVPPDGGTQNDNNLHNCYALDLPGFGKSEVPKKAFTVGDYAEVAEEFIEKVVSTPPSIPPPQGEGRERGNTILVGHSFGGRVAIKLVVTRPDLVQKLVLVDSAGIRVEPPAKMLKNIIAKILKPLFSFGFMQPFRARLYRLIGAEDYIATPELKQTFLNVIAEDLTADLSKINIPTLIIWGEQDKEVPVERGRKMHSLIPNSKFLILHDAGHFCFVDKTEEFGDAVKRFINIVEG